MIGYGTMQSLLIGTVRARLDCALHTHSVRVVRDILGLSRPAAHLHGLDSLQDYQLIKTVMDDGKMATRPPQILAHQQLPALCLIRRAGGCGTNSKQTRPVR